MPVFERPCASCLPERIVAFGERGERTYADLDADSARIATELTVRFGSSSTRGASATPPEFASKPGARADAASGAKPAVLVSCEDRYHFAVALLGTWRARAIAALPHASSESALSDLAGQTELALTDASTPSRAPNRTPTLDVAGLLPRARSARANYGLSSLSLPADAEIARVYTSGTTGTPEPSPKTARELFSEARVLAEFFEFTAEDRVLATVPARHLYGLLFGLLTPLSSGASFCRETLALPDRVLDQASLLRASVLVSVPPVWHALAARGERRRLGVRLGTSSGASLSQGAAAALEVALGFPLYDVLGSTETGGIGARRAASQPAFTPLPGVRITSDVEGRLCLRSPFTRDPDALVTTADRIRLHPDGSFYHLGRSDRVVKVGAKRISLDALERAALGLDGVLEAAAAGCAASDLRGAELFLVVVAPGRTAEAVRRELLGRLDPVSVPRRILVTDALRRGAGGKVSTEDIIALFSKAPNREAGPVARTAHVPDDSPYFFGHFPGDPVFPALALLSELVLPGVRESYPELGALAQLSGVKFFSPICPGTDVALRLERQPGCGEVHFEVGAASDGVGPPLYSSGRLVFSESA